MGWVSMYFAFRMIIASILGVLSGLGVGGGSLLILWLTLIEKMDYADARVINLLFFIPPAAISCYFCRKDLKANISIIVPSALSGLLFASVLSKVSHSWDVSLIRKLFGFLLLAAGIREFHIK